ncbi:type IX secretion system sortase PorU [Anaerophaga thermohalophila]|jgi:hypothetical protein|uniref:type IX secretion system sortase PorU n=1 Tax=Anaerophaga thermohalophila TaxID=177400 RepID=UPI00037E5362|nr:type IX secretion system sortase PorU [Anaerophaga thermohalophila]
MTNNSVFIILISFLLWGFNASDGNEDVNSDHIVKTVEWKESVSYPELPFNGSGYYEDITGLPVFVSLIPFPAEMDYHHAEIEANGEKWSPLQDDKLLTDISESDIPEIFRHRIIFIRKRPYIELEIIPFRISENTEHKWEKLTEFSVKISSPEKKFALKSTALKYVQASKLASGKWVKIGTTQQGIHRISYSTLQNHGFSEPEKVQVYGNGGVMVPMDNSESRPDDLPVISCWHKDNSLFFYSSGPWQWIWNEQKGMFEHKKHAHSSMAYFFLSTADSPKSPVIQQKPEGEATYSTDTYDHVLFHEEENENLLKSGNQWLGEKFSSLLTLERTFSFEIPAIELNTQAHLYTRVAARSNSTQAFDININDNTLESIPVPTVSLSIFDYTYYARTAEGKITFPATASTIDISYQYTNASTSAIGWLDYLILQARSRLTLENGPLVIRDHLSAEPGRVSSFQIADVPSGTVVWDVTNPFEVRQMDTNIAGSTLSFKDSTAIVKEYVAFAPSMNFPEPEFIGEIPNQNLHATSPADMIIVAPEEFIGQANRLADIHTSYSGLSVVVAERDKIYNEFSWGHPDPGAIRGFVKMLYDRAVPGSENAPKLLLLFGDGSYDNRDLDKNPAAPLPTYQSDISFHITNSFVTDDFFGFLDDEEGASLQNDRMDIGIGRFPVSTLEEAVNAVDKTELYLKNQEKGRWKTRLTFIGDDGDGNIHMRDADRLTQKIAVSDPEFEIDKIYFDAYEVTTGAVGREFPGAKADVQKAVSEGTLIFNYSGHGSENNLAHERIVTKNDISSWTNKRRLPLFITATCEFSRFDNHNHTSAGEEVFLSTNGGGIALLSTTRIVYSSFNFTLNNAFYNHAFEYDENGNPLRLGEMMRRTKLESGSNTNKLNFTLLGDPALQLLFPRNRINTLELNGIGVENNTDTISAMSLNTLKAQVIDPDGNPIQDFNGTAYITVYDKAVDLQTLGNDGSEPFEYSEFANILFSGRATVENGEFELSFVVPQDIRYNFDNGRISYYALSDNGREAFGAFSDLVIGGISNETLNDTKGPDIEMYLNHPEFKNGGETGTRPMLYARLFDESGINTSGTGIGHNITLIIDQDTSNPRILNDAYTAEMDDFQSGTIQYQLPQLEEDEHTLTLKVWDNYNNSSTSTLDFRVTQNHGINIRNFRLFPNPVRPGDDVYVTLTTDIPNILLDVTIQFINSAGQVTGTVEDELITSGNFIGPYRLPLEQSGWNHTGICFVRLILKSNKGNETQVTGKLLPALY